MIKALPAGILPRSRCLLCEIYGQLSMLTESKALFAARLDSIQSVEEQREEGIKRTVRLMTKACDSTLLGWERGENGREMGGK